MQELDNRDKKILEQLDLNSRITFKELGKKLRISKETARFRVLRLKENNYIKNFITTIHISNINRFYYKLFFKFHKTTPEVDKRIIKHISNYKSIAYFASLEGRYDITFLILSQNIEDLYKFLVPFKEKFGNYILEQEILTMPSVHRFNLRLNNTTKLTHTKYAEKLQDTKIDQLDKQIITELAKDSRISLRDLAKKTKKEINSVKYRITKLKKSNILGRHVLDINYEKLNLQQVQVDFSLRNHNSIHKLINFAAQIPQSTFATITLGKYDLALEFLTKDHKELRNILNQIKQNFAKEIIQQDIFIMEEHSINWFPL